MGPWMGQDSFKMWKQRPHTVSKRERERQTEIETETETERKIESKKETKKERKKEIEIEADGERATETKGEREREGKRGRKTWRERDCKEANEKGVSYTYTRRSAPFHIEGCCRDARRPGPRRLMSFASTLYHPTFALCWAGARLSGVRLKIRAPAPGPAGVAPGGPSV